MDGEPIMFGEDQHHMDCVHKDRATMPYKVFKVTSKFAKNLSQANFQ